MSKVLKNSLVILLVALFAAVSLSACGQSDKKEPAKAPATSPEEKLSPLELARLEREADRPADKPNAK